MYIKIINIIKIFLFNNFLRVLLDVTFKRTPQKRIIKILMVIDLPFENFKGYAFQITFATNEPYLYSDCLRVKKFWGKFFKKRNIKNCW